MIFYTSDLHFGHKNIIKYDERSFSSIEEMNRILINNWNKRVMPGDTVYILGDFSLYLDAVEEFAPKLNGQKHLILGNHDHHVGKLRPYFETVSDYKVIKDGDVKVVLSHFFMPNYETAYRDGVMLHGHSHRNKNAEAEEELKRIMRDKYNIPCKAYNVGCMYFGYTPATLEEIVNFWETKSVKFSTVERRG